MKPAKNKRLVSRLPQALAAITLLAATLLTPVAQAQGFTPGTIYATTGAGGTPSTLLSIDPDTGITTSIGPVGFDRVGGLDFAPDGTLYGVGLAPGSFVNEVLITIAPDGTGTLVGPITGPAGFSPRHDISFQNASGELFASGKGGILGEHSLGTLNTTTANATEIGLITSAGPPLGAGNGMAFSSTGELLLASELTLYSLDPVTAIATPIATLTYPWPDSSSTRINAMDSDPDSGTLYASVNLGGGQHFIATLDPTTGIATPLILTGASINKLDGIAIAPADPGPSGSQLVSSLDKSKVHFHDIDETYADFKGTLTLLNGDLPEDFRNSSTEAPGALTISFSGSATAAYENPAIVYEVKGIHLNSNKEKWEFKAANKERIILDWKESTSYDANEDPQVEALGLGKLSSEFIHSTETELRFDYKNATLPITLSRNGIDLVTINADKSITQEAGAAEIDPQKGDKVDILLSGGPEAKLVPGDTITWTVNGSPTYTQEINGGTAPTTYFSAGGKFDIRVPITGVTLNDTPLTVTVELTIGNGTTPLTATTTFEVTSNNPYIIDGDKHWKFEANN